jgi:hypothetical protein
VHSDACFSEEDDALCTLGISATAYCRGKLNARITRYAACDLADMVLHGLHPDISSQVGMHVSSLQLVERNLQRNPYAWPFLDDPGTPPAIPLSLIGN